MRRLAPTKKHVHDNIMKDMGAIHTHQEVPSPNMIVLSNSSSPLKHLRKVVRALPLMETWDTCTILVKKWEAVLKYGVRAADLQFLLWHQLLMKPVTTLIINTLRMPLTTNISSSINTMAIQCNTSLLITNIKGRTPIMAISPITHMVGTTDTKVVTMGKQDVSLSSDKSAFFLQWQLIKIACPIDSATFDPRWWKSLPLPKKMCLRDTLKVPRS
mmetsp:Transcript_10016/g.20881  ORF Transcript_10016/g.20881 Transcript_10016/m.20881 type:complete len:215 (-) Transcript_10016:1494-2138(-)